MNLYFDNNATTLTAPDVLEGMLPYFDQAYHNPSSVSGEYIGLRAVIGAARGRIAALIGVSDPSCIVFTSGATESNNWAIVGAIQSGASAGRLVTSAIEHPSVLEPMRRLESNGWQLSVVPVDHSGVIDLRRFAQLLDDTTLLVSIMAANNETGVVQPIAEIGRLVRRCAPNALFHTDAAQAAGKHFFSLTEDFEHVDLLSLSGHKMHGPKGIGALFVREGVRISPLLLGGGQEDGRRSGTTNVPGVVGLGIAAQLAVEASSTVSNVENLRDAFEVELRLRFPDVIIHSAAALRLANTSCFSLPGCSGNVLADLLAANDIWVGTGSACSSGSLRPARSLLEIGVPYEIAAAAIRVSLSRYTEQDDLSKLLAAIDSLRADATRMG